MLSRLVRSYISSPGGNHSRVSFAVTKRMKSIEWPVGSNCHKRTAFS